LKYYVLKGGWFDPSEFHFRLPSFLQLRWAFTTASVTAIDKIGPDKLQFVN